MRVNASLDPATSETDSTVQGGQTYYYIVTAWPPRGPKMLFESDSGGDPLSVATKSNRDHFAVTDAYDLDFERRSEGFAQGTGNGHALRASCSLSAASKVSDKAACPKYVRRHASPLEAQRDSDVCVHGSGVRTKYCSCGNAGSPPPIDSHANFSRARRCAIPSNYPPCEQTPRFNGLPVS
jgi:hypothetical protein